MCDQSDPPLRAEYETDRLVAEQRDQLEAALLEAITEYRRRGGYRGVPVSVTVMVSTGSMVGAARTDRPLPLSDYLIL